MSPTDPLPAAVADWIGRQHDAGIHHTSAAALWHALRRELPNTGTDQRDLLHAYLAGLLPVHPGDRIRPVPDDAGWWRATVMVIATDAATTTLSVRVDRSSPHGPRVGAHLTVDRLAVALLPVIYYTATIVTGDGSDTTAYGEACEPGHGYTDASGWWDPDRSYWTVRGCRDQVSPDVYPHPARRSPAQWLADRLTARLGSIESFDGGRTFYGAREAVHPGRLTGTRADEPGAVIGGGSLLGDALAAARLRQAPVGLATLTAAAHAHGFTAAQLADADRLIRPGGPTHHDDATA